MSDEQIVSLNPATHEESSGFEGPLTIIQARFVEDYDFNGKGKPNNGLLVEFANEAGRGFTQFYGIGDKAKWAIIDDGKKLKYVGNTKVLNTASKTSMLMAELVNCGFDADILDAGDVSCLDGLHAEWGNRKTEEFTGRESKTQKGEDAKVLVPSEIYLHPGDDETDAHTRFEVSEEATGTKSPASKKKKAPAAKKGAAKKAPAKSKSPSAEDLAAEAQGAVLQALVDSDGSMKKNQLMPALIKGIPNDNPAKADVIKLATSADFLGDSEYWSLEDGVLTQAE